MKKILSCWIGVLACVTVLCQVNKMPAYPLVTHDPYFSIWSFTDKVNESTTRHWTGKDHSLLGLINVDGKIYKFLGAPEKQFKAILPHREDNSYSSRFIESDPGQGWENISFDDKSW